MAIAVPIAGYGDIASLAERQDVIGTVKSTAIVIVQDPQTGTEDAGSSSGRKGWTLGSEDRDRAVSRGRCAELAEGISAPCPHRAAGQQAQTVDRAPRDGADAG